MSKTKTPAEIERRMRMEKAREPFTLHKSKQPVGFLVQKKMCPTCIYRPDSPLDLNKLEDQVRDPHMGFKGHRICHHHSDDSGVCCRGFWNAHKDDFPAGQIAQRLGLVQLVALPDKGSVPARKKKQPKVVPSGPEVLPDCSVPEEILKRAIFTANRVAYEEVCRLVVDSDRLPANIYRQQKRAAK